MPRHPPPTDALRALVRAARLLERASGDLSLAQYRVLAAISEGDERATRLAQRLALGKPTISATVDALCRRGLVMREGVAGDQRAAALRPTVAGETALHAAEAAMLARLESVLGHAADRRALLAALIDLGAAMDADRQALHR